MTYGQTYGRDSQDSGQRAEVYASDVPPCETFRRARVAGIDSAQAWAIVQDVHGLDADAARYVVGAGVRLSN